MNGQRNDIQKALRRLAVATVVLFLASASLFVLTTAQDRQNDKATAEAIAAIEEIAIETNKEAAQTHDALCVFVTNVEDQVKASEDFLRRYPNGIEGISAADIQAGIDRQTAVVESLAGLECKVGEE